VWIFSAAGNESSVRGIRKAGFVYRFSLVRRRRLFHTTIARSEEPSFRTFNSRWSRGLPL